jgi:phosphoglycolate phosphatase-like HAD superfamily hydrolase
MPTMTALLSVLLLIVVQHADPFSMPMHHPPKPKGVIFDMDGTLIRSVIDFADMRRRIYELATQDLGVSVQEGDILALATRLSETGQAKAKLVFEDVESKALRDMELNPGMLALCQLLDEEQIPRALLTRNVESSVEYMHQNKMGSIPRFQPAISRDSVDREGNIIRPKPFPDAILHICQQWGCDPSQVVMVGDSLQDDVVAANRAGCISIHLSTMHDNDSGNAEESSDGERVPNITIQSLRELQEMLQSVCVSRD